MYFLLSSGWVELRACYSIRTPESLGLSMKSYELYRFFARNSGMPSYVIFHVTSLCNSRCITCFNWKNLNKKDELKLDEIGKVSEKMEHIGYLTLGGGEP